MSGELIRANQGHSVEVDLQLEEREPPETLYHGTVERFLPSILEEGLIRGKRHHVHLSRTWRRHARSEQEEASRSYSRSIHAG